jgi:hypothetical protein
VSNPADACGEDAAADGAERRGRMPIGVWTAVGIASGASLSGGVEIHPQPASTLAALAGFATGVAVGVRGLVAIAAGAMAFAVVAGLE